jgi:hypothetical protein
MYRKSMKRGEGNTYIKLLLGLGEASAVYSIYNEDDSVHAGSEVVSPQLSRCSIDRNRREVQPSVEHRVQEQDQRSLSTLS